MDDDTDHVNSSELCDSCQGINIESISARRGYRHAPDKAALSLRQKRCALCRTLAILIDQKLENSPDNRTRSFGSRIGQLFTGGGIRLFLDRASTPAIKLVAPDVGAEISIPLKTVEGNRHQHSYVDF